MDRSLLDSILVRLSLDGVPSAVCGMEGFPLLGVDGSVLYGRAKTVLVASGYGRFSQKPGVEFAVVGRSGQPLEEFHGARLHGGRSESTIERFIEQFGSLFDRNEVEIEMPEDPFARFLMAG